MVYNSRKDTIQISYRHHIFKKIIAENPDITHFASLTNSLAFFKKPENVHYWHHFGLRDASTFDLAGRFSTCNCALDIMLGMAKYLGFAKVILLGCDYLCTPKMEGHFYSNAVPVFGKDDIAYAKSRKNVAGSLDVLVVCPKGVSSEYFPWVTFDDYFGAQELYQSNEEIIENDYLNLLRKVADKGLVWM